MHASYGHPDHACEICCSENTDTCDHYCALLSKLSCEINFSLHFHYSCFFEKINHFAQKQVSHFVQIAQFCISATAFLKLADRLCQRICILHKQIMHNSFWSANSRYPCEFCKFFSIDNANFLNTMKVHLHFAAISSFISCIFRSFCKVRIKTKPSQSSFC